MEVEAQQLWEAWRGLNYRDYFSRLITVRIY
jgi:hypothetical protein